MWLFVLGVVAIAKILNILFKGIDRAYNNHLRSILAGKDLQATYGEWAAVTGATSGIGRALVDEFASKGLNIVLISRDEKKLQKACSEVEKTYNVKTKYFTLDFSTRASSLPIAEELKQLDLGILVNNVGWNSPTLGPFFEIPQSDIRDIISVNCGAALELTLHLTKSMEARNKPSLIVFNSSTSAVIPAVYISPYSASKIFLDVWCKAFSSEIAGTQLKTKIIRPLLVETNMTNASEAATKNFIVVSPSQYAKATCRTLFTEIPTSGMPFSDFILFLMSSVPQPFAMMIMERSFKDALIEQREREKAAASR